MPFLPLILSYYVLFSKIYGFYNTVTLLLKVRNLGKPVDLAGQYYKDGADEVFPNVKMKLISVLPNMNLRKGV